MACFVGSFCIVCPVIAFLLGGAKEGDSVLVCVIKKAVEVKGCFFILETGGVIMNYLRFVIRRLISDPVQVSEVESLLGS